MFMPGLGNLKPVLMILAAGTIALLWIRPLVENNKRLCYSIVFGLLILVVLIGYITGGNSGRQPDTQQASPDQAVTPAPELADPYAAAEQNPVTVTEPIVTNTPEPDQDSAVTGRLQTFYSYWMVNNQDGMLTLCSPTWQSKQENPKTALFGLMGNRTPKEDIVLENISGTPNDTTRTVTITVLMDPNNGKDPVRYRIGVIMVKENDGLWYVDPNSIMSNDKAETPDPSITETPAPTETPSITVNTVLYFNPNIYPEEEYAHRLSEQARLLEELGVPLICVPYDHQEFLDRVQGLESEPEGGRRCEKCFELRLEKTLELAKQGGFQYFATTLTVSPHKNAVVINRIGEALAAAKEMKKNPASEPENSPEDTFSAAWLPSDFKKRDGYKQSIELSRKYNLYRQDYCGCEFAMGHLLS